MCSIMGMKELYYDSNLVCTGEVQFIDPTIRPGCPVRIQAVDDSLYIGDTFFITVLKDGDYEGGMEVSLWNGVNRVRTYRSRTAETFDQLTFQIDARVHSFFDREPAGFIGRMPQPMTTLCTASMLHGF